MCGIAGYITKNGNIHKESIKKMTSIIKHRGPDDSGIEFLKIFNNEQYDMALGFVRLSIRDLSMNGHQPMFNKERNIVIAFNGEIYNADSIRERLIKEGINFHSTSDTEVILMCYEKYGLEYTLQCLNGMYAIVLCDLKRDCVYFIRDRVGEKPLYYYQTENTFLFSSEYKAFYAHPDFTAELNNEVLDEYYLYRYVSGNETLLRNVFIVRPGHYLVMDKNGIIEKKYYELPSGTRSHSKTVQKEFEKVLMNSVTSRMVSDVEVGVQLSGGVDSSLVMYFANQKNRNMKSFSMIFDNPDYSEETYIDYALKVTGGDAHKYKMKKDDFLKNLIDSTWNFEAPINHHGSVQLYYLCSLAQKKVNVILTGEGADELFGGYGWYPVSMFYQNKKFIWKLRTFLHKVKHVEKKYWEDCKEFSDEEKFLLCDSQITPDLMKEMTPQLDYKKVLNKRKKIYKSCQGNNLEQKLNYEMKTFMVDLLLRQDKISMASSIECRVPFVDQDLIAFTRNNINADDMLKCQSFKKQKQNTKLVLKKLAAKYFGEEFTYRTKMGLPSPLEDYFYEDQFADYMKEVLLPKIKKRGLFNYDFIEKCYKQKKHLQTVVWRAVTFELWAMMYIDQGGAEVLRHAGL